MAGPEVHEHIGNVINRIVLEQPKDAFGLVEVLSRLVKESGGETTVPPQPTEEEIAQRSEHSKKVHVLNKVPQVDGERVTVCAIPYFMAEADLAAWAGVGFGDVESYKITCSMRNIAAKEKEAGFLTLRFWGKFLGTEKDYYVAEISKEGGGDDPPAGEEDNEPLGTGANTYVYYVTTDLCEDWVKLPELKPKQIMAARRIKRLVTGNLKAKVVTVPHFPGDEAVFLRAQIALITADTHLCVKGYLMKDEEGVIAQNPEFVYPRPAELLNLESWTHMRPHILKNGRTTHFPETLPELEDESEETAAQNAETRKMMAEREADPIRDTVRDVKSDGMKWIVKQSGDVAVYKNPLPLGETPKLTVSNTTTYLRSHTWPGAVCIARNGTFINLYIGYGLKAGGPEFFIRAPEDVQDEPADEDEVEEPQGTLEEEPPKEG
eukprot:TRINITY_DN3489_c0_g1_i1.p1 TRINITY_DN3489_c0_g1~~TRINITY_DN3489_c0_g1_i1.p1  ORF type:complete len:435 (-),score=84.88 TRINITY_DN3489_c0_g1_i1:33-1337(-)